MSILSYNDVYIYRENKLIVKNLNFDINKRTIVALIGGSGLGKSTILEAIINKKIIKSGKIIAPKKISYMPQSIDEKEVGLSILELLVLSINKSGYKTSKEEYIRAEKILKELNLLKNKNSIISELSGGELQRFSIARAIYQDYDLFILDEPTSGSDIFTSNEIKSLILKYSKNFNKTIFLATHDINIIKEADFILYIKDDKSYIYNKNEKSFLREIYGDI